MSIEVVNRRKFEADLEKFADSLGLEVVTVQKKVALDIFGDLVAGTPVDTGRAMNNWNISVGVLDKNTTDIGGTDKAIEAIKSAAALSELATLKPFQTVWLSNSVGYIGFLEEGSSIQAPNGWVERAVNNNMAVLEL